MEYKIWFYAGSRYAVELSERTVGTWFVDLVRQTAGYNVPLSVINCQIPYRLDTNICYTATEAQAIESARFTWYCRLNYASSAGFLNDCIDIDCSISPSSATGWNPTTNPVTNASPIRRINRDRVWAKWKALGFPVTTYPYYASVCYGTPSYP